jgi:PAS domain S-box-containing protein
VLENSLDASYKRNLQTNAYDYLSPVFARISGYTPDEMKSLPIKTVMDLIHPDDQAEIESVITEPKSGATCAACQVEYRFKHKEGHHRWFHDRFTIMRDPEGQPVALIGSVSDITDRKQAKEALLTSETHLRTLVQTIPDLIWLKDPEGVYLDCNAMFERLFGAEKKDIIGKTDYDFVDRELADFFREHNRKAMAAGKPSSNEEWLTFADDGYQGLFDTIKTPMCNAHGKLIGVLGIARNITDRKRVDKALRESEERYRKAFMTSPDSIVITRLSDGMFVSINKGFTEISGHEEEDVIGKTSLEINIWGNPEDRIKIIEGLKAKGEVRNYEARFLAKDREFYGLMSASIIELNGVPHVLNVTRDITERKRAEEEKAKLEALLQQAQKMESIGSLAGGIAHDLNNILFPITGLSEMLLDDIPPKTPEHDSIEQIYKSAKRGSELVKQILAFSRQSNPKKLPIRIQSILKETLKLYPGQRYP